MELFTLGADRGAYTEDDIRAAAKALTGWRADYVDGIGMTNFRFVASRHDTTNKTIFGQTGNWSWQDVCQLCLENPLPPVVLRDQAVVLLRAGARRTSRRRRRSRRPTSTAATRSRRCWS